MFRMMTRTEKLLYLIAFPLVVALTVGVGFGALPNPVEWVVGPYESSTSQTATGPYAAGRDERGTVGGELLSRQSTDETTTSAQATEEAPTEEAPTEEVPGPFVEAPTTTIPAPDTTVPAPSTTTAPATTKPPVTQPPVTTVPAITPTTTTPPTTTTVSATVPPTTTVPVDPLAALVENGVESVFQPEFGARLSGTARFTKTSLTVYIDSAVSASKLSGFVGEALTFVSNVTGITFVAVPVAEGSDIQILEPQGSLGSGVSGKATYWRKASNNEIIRAEVQLLLDMRDAVASGVVYEELIQMMGPAGDWGPNGSLLNDNDSSLTKPSPFDRHVLAVLYSLALNSSEEAYRAAW